ncbi:hypothetical protein HG15A2_32620 [Adhaeretor mobilis]|uniref:Uncharacterized protein n=1 Tax=Adhaeretor mobilis TaxID=1930276 RepID=A0A517MYH1_9BACT|nr:hypothetical protein HG15A2_32620 [Adhaeretor mobilis]
MGRRLVVSRLQGLQRLPLAARTVTKQETEISHPTPRKLYACEGFFVVLPQIQDSLTNTGPGGELPRLSAYTIEDRQPECLRTPRGDLCVILDSLPAEGLLAGLSLAFFGIIRFTRKSCPNYLDNYSQ